MSRVIFDVAMLPASLPKLMQPGDAIRLKVVGDIRRLAFDILRIRFSCVAKLTVGALELLSHPGPKTSYGETSFIIAVVNIQLLPALPHTLGISLSMGTTE